jgi:predicted ATPase
MITRIEAFRYRCFDDLGVNLGDPCVIVGANGAGKTTLLDIPSLIGDMVGATSIATAFLRENHRRVSRASSLTELIHQGQGETFMFAIEARLPEQVVTQLLESSTETVKANEKLWPKFIRYELRLQVFNQRELQVQNEYIYSFSEQHRPEHPSSSASAYVHGESNFQRSWIFALRRDRGDKTEIQPEVKEPFKKHRPPVKSASVPADRLAFGLIGFEGTKSFPAANWLLELLTRGAVFFDPDWSQLAAASAPGRSKEVTADGQNLPWLAMELKQLDSDRFEQWREHVSTALRQVTAIEVIEREEDHHAYFKLTYNGKYTVTSSGLSDGTLRILAITLLSYFPRPPALLVIEEPENGIHPRAIEAVLGALSAIRNCQVFISSHSPVVVANTDLANLYAARVDRNGAATIIAGKLHPRMAEWKGEVDLATLFATGVFG